MNNTNRDDTPTELEDAIAYLEAELDSLQGAYKDTGQRVYSERALSVKKAIKKLRAAPPTESVEGQNKSGIPEYDELVMGYQAGDITFNTLCSRLWNTGIKYGKQEATHPTPPTESVEDVEDLHAYKMLTERFDQIAEFTKSEADVLRVWLDRLVEKLFSTHPTPESEGAEYPHLDMGEVREKLITGMIKVFDPMRESSADTILNQYESNIAAQARQKERERMDGLIELAENEAEWAKQNVPHEDTEKDKEWNHGYRKAMTRMADELKSQLGGNSE